MKVKELSKKEIREILEKISEYYGINFDFLQELSKNFCWLSNKEGKIYILDKSVKKYIKLFQPHRFGMYIAKKEKNYIRLSIEGAQLFGTCASKRVLETDAKIVLTKDELKIQLEKGYYILKSQKDYLGSGFSKNGKLKVMISKNRKILCRGEEFDIKEELSEE